MADQKNPTILNRIARGIGIFSFLMLIASGVLAFLYRQMFVEFWKVDTVMSQSFSQSMLSFRSCWRC